MPDSSSKPNAIGERRRICDYLQDRRARSSELKQAFTALLELDASLMELAPTDNASLELEVPPDIPALAAARVVRVQLSDIEPLEARLARPR